MKHGVLIDRELLDGLVKVLDNAALPVTAITLQRAIESAPEAVIPIEKVTSCHDCPCRQFTQMEYVYCELYHGDENIDKHWENHTSPLDCPIITKG